MRFLPVGFLLSALMLGCAAPADEGGVSSTRRAFSGGPGALRGHEDLTRLAVDLANGAIEGEFGIAGLYPAIESGDDCWSTAAPMLVGNCATDSPDEVMSAFYGVSGADWQTAPGLQNLHFLRNYVGDSGVETAWEACMGARDFAARATGIAVEAWNDGRLDDALYWLGHATHILQDSFATPHAVREGTLLRHLLDVCSYRREVAGVCYHSMVELSGDRVWLDSWDCEMDPFLRSWDCLKPEAQSAVLATAGYLIAVGRVLVGSDDLDGAIADVFAGRLRDDYTGYFGCSTLDGPPPGSACAADSDCPSGACVDDMCCSTRCDGPCEACDAPGSPGTCSPTPAGSDPRGMCRSASACGGTCDGAGACAFPGGERSCGLCAACDGEGYCATVPEDDEACGTIDCSGLDTRCRAYRDVTAGRCSRLGTCLPPDSPETCTEWDDLDCGDDGGTPADDDDGGLPPATGDGNDACACAIPGAGPSAPASAFLLLPLAAFCLRRRG